MTTSNTMIQKIEVPFPVGSRVTLLKDVDIDSQEGSSGTVLFEDYVEQYVPKTGLLRFEDSDIGRSQFKQLADEADAMEIISNYEKV